MISRLAVCAAVAMVSPAAALEFHLPPAARLTVERDTAPDSYAAPVGIFEDGEMPVVVIEGDIDRSVWRLEAAGLTPLQVMRPLRRQIEQAGYDIVLDCTDEICGGYDFRFATETLPGPNLYVNIRAFHFVTAIRGARDAPDSAITMLTSSSASSAYVQIIEAVATKNESQSPVPAEPPAPTEGFAGIFLEQGHVVLSALDFGTATSGLGAGPFPRLQELADFLQERPGISIVVVGHTDTVGGLDSNIALSRARAQSVRSLLIDVYGVAPERIDAEGMGYLAPVASNLTAEGREANRRVEVILLSE